MKFTSTKRSFSAGCLSAHLRHIDRIYKLFGAGICSSVI